LASILWGRTPQKFEHAFFKSGSLPNMWPSSIEFRSQLWG